MVVMQFSLFGAEVAEPALDDLAGIVLAGGDWVRAGADFDVARLSIVVVEPWRTEPVAAAFRELGVGSDIGPAENGLGVRTDFTARLAPEAAKWVRGAVLHPPTDLALTARGLRLWAIAAGRVDAGGYLLGTADPFDPTHRAAGAQLARLGLAATAMTTRTQPGWRVTSVKRLRRLAELLGEPPPGAADDWPG
jgi:hypothetical protein